VITCVALDCMKRLDLACVSATMPDSADGGERIGATRLHTCASGHYLLARRDKHTSALSDRPVFRTGFPGTAIGYFRHQERELGSGHSSEGWLCNQDSRCPPGPVCKAWVLLG